MRYKDVENRLKRKLESMLAYRYCYYLEFDYSILNNILKRKKNGSKSNTTYGEAYIMLDTETSKHHEPEFDSEGKMINQENHICLFTISIRAFSTNICTLRGTKPSELTHCLSLIRKNIKADVVYIFVHNLAYDWQFIRRFMFTEFGKPYKQLNVKNHYPITIQFVNGLILRDSLILAGVSLERWGANLGIEHQKAVGYWDYDKIRNQSYIFTDDELKYAEFDTLAGVECLNKLADGLGDTVVSLPYTNTGIVRRRIQQVGRSKYAKTIFNKQLITLEQYHVLESVFHGGFTHANRAVISWPINDVTCLDFKSSYPYCMLVTKMPCEPYMKIDDCSIEHILEQSDYSFICKLILINPRLHDKLYPMPCLQFSKCVKSINVIKDNGRILCADYVEIYVNEIDLKLIYEIYDYDLAVCCEVLTAYKDYLPKWYRDEIFKIFQEKCELEYLVKVENAGDVSQYNVKKAQLNSLYGNSVMKAIKEEIKESYEDSDDPDGLKSGDYYIDEIDEEAIFKKYLVNRKNVLPYVWGVYTTSAAMSNLFELSKCINDVNHHWLYSDTDSIYSDGWNMKAVKAFNDKAKSSLIDAGYGAVKVKDKEYWLGVAEIDSPVPYDKFITQGAKRYAVEIEGKVKITVAGVPKKTGAKCLKSIDDFKEGYIFPGTLTGKTTHTYINDDIHIDDKGNECADSIDLTPADYTLSSVDMIEFKDLFMEEVTYDWFEDD